MEGGPFILDYAVYEQGEQKKKGQIEAKEKDRWKKELEFMINCYHGDKVMEKMNTTDVKKWRNMNLIKSYLKPLQHDGDPLMPMLMKRNGLETCFLQWSDRKHFRLVPEEDVMQDFQRWKRAFEGEHKKK